MIENSLNSVVLGGIHEKFLVIVTTAMAFLSALFQSGLRLWSGKPLLLLNDSNPNMYWAAPVYGDSEQAAASHAMSKCENASARTCNRQLATSAPTWWWLVVSWCDDVATTGGSKFDKEAANSRAAMKLGYHDGSQCSILQVYAPE